MANKFIKGLVEKLTMLADDWFVIQPDAEESIAYKIKKSNVKSDRTEPNTWYLNSDSGDDDNVGSANFPFEDPQAAHDAADEGDILVFQNREYFSNQNVTVTKSLTLKGSIPANDNDIAVPFIGGNWGIAAGKDLMIINMWVRADFTHPSVSWFLQMTGCHFDGTLPDRKTRLILNDCLWELGSGQDLFSLVMYNTKTFATSTIDVGKSFTIQGGSTFQGSIIAGLDSSAICLLTDSSIEGNVTITGTLDKLNAVIVGTETVSGTTTSRQAKVFDDSVEFKQEISANQVAVGKALASFALDVLGQSFIEGKGTWVAPTGTDAIALNVGTQQQFSIVSSIDDGTLLVPVAVDGRANNNIILTQHTNKTRDHDHSTLSTHPTFIYHSNTDPNVNNTEWGSLSFIGDGAGGGFFQINVGTGYVNFPSSIRTEGSITQKQIAEPADPADGESVQWTHDGSGGTYGQGDVVMKSTFGTTKAQILLDWSAL